MSTASYAPGDLPAALIPPGLIWLTSLPLILRGFALPQGTQRRVIADYRSRFNHEAVLQEPSAVCVSFHDGA
jgi:hypothetical protein